MSLATETNDSRTIPEETAILAQAIFPKGNIYVKMRDEIGPLFEDKEFATLFSQRGQPAEAPWRRAAIVC